ncbi:MAG: hypothetical protein WB755_06810 [Terriglobales bacterium]
MAAATTAAEDCELFADELAATTGEDRGAGVYYWLLLAEGHLNRRRFGAMLGNIALPPLRKG